MDTKLTLKLDKDIIEKAKDYAASQNKSLSRLIESYLQSLVDEKEDAAEPKISPFVTSMRSGVSVPSDIDYKKLYGDYVDEKYK